MRDALDASTVGALVGSQHRLHADLAAGKSRLIFVVDVTAGSLAVFAVQCVIEGHGGFKVRHRDGHHIGSFADFGMALAAGVTATERRSTTTLVASKVAS